MGEEDLRLAEPDMIKTLRLGWSLVQVLLLSVVPFLSFREWENEWLRPYDFQILLPLIQSCKDQYARTLFKLTKSK